jgi:RNA polymerase sigma-70 factor (ECF subfamily)
VAALFDEHAGMVLGLCRLLLRDHHEAEDAAQQTFVSAYRSLLRGTEPREPGPWLAAIARNECRGRLRRRMRAPLALDGELEQELADTSDLAELADRRAELAQLATEIAKLPSRQREALALRDFLGLSYEEVASTLSVSVPVVESLLFRARRRLRDTVRTVPRYAAGIVIVPIALRAAVARDVPDFDAITIGLGVAGVAGAAAGGIAKLLSVPASVKVAATLAVVATGSVVAPKLMTPAQEAAPPPSAISAQSWDADTPGPTSPRTVEPAPPEARAAESEPAAADAAAVDTAPAPDEASAPAAEPEDVPIAEADPGRISSSTPGGALPPPPPPPPGTPAECPPAEDETDGQQPTAEPECSGDDESAPPEPEAQPAPGSGPEEVAEPDETGVPPTEGSPPAPAGDSKGGGWIDREDALEEHPTPTPGDDAEASRGDA